MGARDRDEDKDDNSGKGWCVVIIIILLVVIIIIVVLALTVFKVRDPQITVNSIQLRSFSLTFPPNGPQLSFILDIDVAVKNRNHASFKYEATTAYIYYHGAIIGQAPLQAGTVKAESTTTIATEADIDASAFLGNPNLLGDVQAGVVPLVTTTRLPGRIDVATIVKKHAVATTSCNLNVYVLNPSVGGFSCSYKISL